MSTCLNEIKINTKNYIATYIENFDRVIHQKDKDRRQKIEQIMAKLREEKIFEIEGDYFFKERIYTYIENLLTVKPGRLLIKELIKSATLFKQHKLKNYKQSIVIRNGDRGFHYYNGIIEINPNQSLDNYYHALSESKKVIRSKPGEIILAHELIHSLHKREEELQEMAKRDATRCQRLKCPPPDYLKNMTLSCNPAFDSGILERVENELIIDLLDCTEEEHTILGINIPRFLKKNKTMNKVDILCENAFLCAFNLSPRINHQGPINKNIKTFKMNENDLSFYYNWVSLQLDKRNENIEKKYPNISTLAIGVN